MIDLEVLLESFLKNRKRLLGAFCGFVLGQTYIKYGLYSALILAIFTIIGYNYSGILKRIKAIIRERIDEEY